MNRKQTIHIKFQDSFSLNKTTECRLLQILLGALMVKTTI